MLAQYPPIHLPPRLLQPLVDQIPAQAWMVIGITAAVAAVIQRGFEMREFFKGWRRTAGCVALVVAILLVVAWNRSQSYSDTLVMRRLFTMYGMISSDAGLEFFVADFPTAEASSKLVPSGWSSDRIRRSWDGRVLDINSSMVIGLNLWSWKRFGFGGFENRIGDVSVDCRVKAVIIPFWSVIALTTLLSIYLLLWKPRERTGPVHA